LPGKLQSLGGALISHQVRKSRYLKRSKLPGSQRLDGENILTRRYGVLSPISLAEAWDPGQGSEASGISFNPRFAGLFTALGVLGCDNVLSKQNGGNRSASGIFGSWCRVLEYLSSGCGRLFHQISLQCVELTWHSSSSPSTLSVLCQLYLQQWRPS
jgi:hypothetical protein